MKVHFDVSHVLSTVHGFENHTYSTLENTTLHTINFMPDVKGNGTRGNLLVGVIDTAFTGTGSEWHNFNDTQLW